ncbi:MAG: 4-hydroxy-tetrahydrodipicolinate synthase [Succinivibrio sp.]|nr:4-hydroxy-tetrahydrodipicolinate synthase [Succinivibrio sp.]
MQHLFHGSIVAMVTPFKNGKLDEQAIADMTEWHIKNGTNAIVPAGTTGECPTLSHEEHIKVVEIVAATAKGRIPVLAGAGSNNPVEAVYLSQAAERAGANGLLHVAGYYNRPNQDGLYAHFKMVHDESSLPIIVYNVPGRVIVDVKPETLAKLSELPRIAGIKDATGDLERPLLERQLVKKEGFTWLSGNDSTQVSYNLSGGVGCISVSANVAPALLRKVQDLCAEGKWAEAAALQDKLTTLHKLMFVEPSPGPAKYAASLLGLCSEEVRLPILAISASLRERIQKCLHELELI